MRTSGIVVAVDGTEPSRAAVRWAAREARHSNRTLLVTRVLDWDWAANRYDFGGQRYETDRRTAEGIAANAANDARQVAPQIQVDTDVLVGNPVAQLVIASEQADLLVLGHRGLGGFAGLGLGSVSLRVAVHAHCPVVVARGRTDTEKGPVAVGVDDAASADQVLEAAFTAAAQRGTSLAAVRSCPPVLPLYWGGFPPPEDSTAEQDVLERARFDEQLAPWRAKYPDVRTEALLSHDSAAATLTDISHGAQVVVVGSRGHGIVAGSLLGSTGLQLLHHADCPVLIVRPQDRRDPR